MKSKLKLNYKPRTLIKKIIYVFKIMFGMIFCFTIGYTMGTFMPNDYTEKRITKRIETRIYQEHAESVDRLSLKEPAFEYETNVQFINAVHKCVDYINYQLPIHKRVPLELVTAQAALESGWGTSRFAKVANNLFGIKTWNIDEGVLPKGYSEYTPWRVRKFETKCDSVKEYIRLLNEHTAYESFRVLRSKQILGNNIDPIKLAYTLTKFSTTDDYPKLVKRIILKIRKMDLAALDVVAFNAEKAINIEVELKEKPEVILPEKKPEVVE